jgi:urea transport system ATP-binding protein
MLSIKDVNVYYGAVKVLYDISLQIDSGEPVCVLGKNGVGKTTLLKSIIGLVPPRSGTIELDGEPVEGQPPFSIARKGVAYVPQGNQLFPDMTVEENLFLAVRDRKVFDGRVDIALNYFPILKDKFRHRAAWLSGGQQKFLAISRALITRPRVLLLDEPSEGIQPNIVQELAHIIRSIVEEQKCTLLLVEQNRDLAFRVANRSYIIDRGRVVAEGTPKELEAKGVVRQYLSF